MRWSAVKLPPAVGGLLAVAVAVLVLTGCDGATNDAEPDPSAATTTRQRDRSYHGVGSQIIGTLTFPSGAEAAWTSTGGLFMLIAVNAPASAQLIVSKEASGTDFVPAGSYVLKVGTLPASRWTLTFRKRSAHDASDVTAQSKLPRRAPPASPRSSVSRSRSAWER
jgi:hypothetical protein